MLYVCCNAIDPLNTPRHNILWLLRELFVFIEIRKKEKKSNMADKSTVKFPVIVNLKQYMPANKLNNKGTNWIVDWIYFTNLSYQQIMSILESRSSCSLSPMCINLGGHHLLPTHTLILHVMLVRTIKLVSWRTLTKNWKHTPLEGAWVTSSPNWN